MVTVAVLGDTFRYVFYLDGVKWHEVCYNDQTDIVVYSVSLIFLLNASFVCEQVDRGKVWAQSSNHNGFAADRFDHLGVIRVGWIKFSRSVYHGLDAILGLWVASLFNVGLTHGDARPCRNRVSKCCLFSRLLGCLAGSPGLARRKLSIGLLRKD